MNITIGYTDTNQPINIHLKMLNRHGLVCGSTGSGKTKTVQLLAEQLSLSGVPSFHLDIKGDLSGIGGVGVKNSFIESRYKEFGINYEPRAFPTKFFSISEATGYKLKFSLIDFGAIYIANVLRLNVTQEGLMMVLFKFAGDEGIRLNCLNDLIELIIWAMTEEGQVKISLNYGRMSGASLSTVLRKIVGFQDQGGDSLFSFNSFTMGTFIQPGQINILSVTDLQTKQEMFSAFLLKFLIYMYEELPEVGDLDKPKFVFFIDEAHLIFKQARKELAEKLENIVRLIRSKGVGLIFCTQSPADIPDSVLGQLGLKIQHTLRAFTAKDRTALKKAAENYPLAPGMKVKDVEALMTRLNIAEALVSALDEQGNPTPVQHTLLLAPQSKMGILGHIPVDESLSRYGTPATGTPLEKYIQDNKSALTTLASENPKFDFYQVLKVVSPNQNRPTPPTQKNMTLREKIEYGIKNDTDRYPPSVISVMEQLVILKVGVIKKDYGQGRRKYSYPSKEPISYLFKFFKDGSND